MRTIGHCLGALLAVSLGLLACAGDESSESSFGPDVPTAGDEGTAGPDASSTGAASGGTDSGSSGTPPTTATDTGADITGDPASTGAVMTDPDYPSPVGGVCAGGEAVVVLPGASVCAPFCGGADAACPNPATGSATGQCTPFEQPGGSGTACTTHAQCPADEACGVQDTCVSVAFWGCRLLCDAAMCPDGMLCATGDVCGYPD